MISPSRPLGAVSDLALPHTRHFSSPHGGVPRTQLLSNGRYTVGSGYSRWQDPAITRWREDATCDDTGSYILLRDVAGGDIDSEVPHAGRGGELASLWAHKPFFMPFDHRHSYLTGMFDLTPPLTADQHDVVADSKQLIYEGFRHALGGNRAGGNPRGDAPMTAPGRAHTTHAPVPGGCP